MLAEAAPTAIARFGHDLFNSSIMTMPIKWPVTLFLASLLAVYDGQGNLWRNAIDDVKNEATNYIMPARPDVLKDG